jgi:hypothetical protein
MPRKSNKESSTRSTSNKKSSSQTKYEIAEEMGVELGANATARENGMVGAEVKKRQNQSSKRKSSR